jgi:hypothetical protein
MNVCICPQNMSYFDGKATITQNWEKVLKKEERLSKPKQIVLYVRCIRTSYAGTSVLMLLCYRTENTGSGREI